MLLWPNRIKDGCLRNGRLRGHITGERVTLCICHVKSEISETKNEMLSIFLKEYPTKGFDDIAFGIGAKVQAGCHLVLVKESIERVIR